MDNVAIFRWKAYFEWRSSGRLGRWLFHPVISYMHRLHSFKLTRVRNADQPLEKDAHLFWGDKMWVTLPEEVSSYIYRYQYFEPELTRALLHFLQPGMTFLDIGAHYGYFSKLASYLVGMTGRVYSMEPVPSTFQMLKKNTTAHSNVMAFQKAAFSSTGRMKIRDYGILWSAFNSFSQARTRGVDKDEYREEVVDVVTIDDFAAKHGFAPQFVKIDAESAELEILKGMTKIISDFSPVISLEVGDEIKIENAPLSAQLVEYMYHLGYEPFTFDGVNFVKHVIRSSYSYGNILFFPKK